jgi:hypothetical protein
MPGADEGRDRGCEGSVCMAPLARTGRATHPSAVALKPICTNPTPIVQNVKGFNTCPLGGGPPDKRASWSTTSLNGSGAREHIPE